VPEDAKHVIVDASVKEVGAVAFGDCTSLKKVEVPPIGLTKVGEARSLLRM
jgi:hypothetical protein